MSIKAAFTDFFNSKNTNIEDCILQATHSWKPKWLYKIYSKTFYDYYNNTIQQSFSKLTEGNIISCDKCRTAPQPDYSLCIDNHDINSISPSFDAMFSFLSNVIETEQHINTKFQSIFEQKSSVFPACDIALSKEIIFNNMNHVLIFIRIKIYLLLDKYKRDKNISDQAILIPWTIKMIMVKLNIFDIYQEIVNDYLKITFLQNIKNYMNQHSLRIVTDIINTFDRHFLEWAYINITFQNKPDTLFSLNTPSNWTSLTQDKSMYKSKFISYIKTQFVSAKLSNFFDIINSFPNSKDTLLDIKDCISEYNKNEFISKINTQISTRLLTPGISTRLIIEIFIRIIKIMKIIEPCSYILDCISTPIKDYWRTRRDTMQWIVSTIIGDEDVNMMEDMSKAYVHNIKSLDYDYMSSDEEPEKWEPRIIKGINIKNEGASDFHNKASDIISTWVNIFGSPVKFMEQYRRMLAERKITENNFNWDNEIKNLELLKLKFGETLIQSCDIVIRDIKESNKWNKNDIKDPLISCLVINKYYWPFLEESQFDINELQKEDIVTPYDKFLADLSSKFDNYKSSYLKRRISRKWTFFSNVGYMTLTLTFKNGVFNFIVTLWSGMIIKMFDNDNKEFFPQFTYDYISAKWGADIVDVKHKLLFWVTKGVLTEVKEGGVGNMSNGNSFFRPNEYWKHSEYVSNLIIEEDIFIFHYQEPSLNTRWIENSIVSILKNSGPKTFEHMYKNLVMSYQLEISEIKLKDLLGKMILEQKICKKHEDYQWIVHESNKERIKDNE